MTKSVSRLRGALKDRKSWSADEDRVLRHAYADGGIEAAQAALPERSACAIYRRAERLGISRRRRWTEADDQRLRKFWDGELSLREIAKRLQRTEATTYWRAQKLGLPLGCPDGWEYLTHAAQRTGYATKQLRPILYWAIVELLGHVRIAGRVSQVERYGAKMGRIDIPQADGSFVTQFFGGGSIYRETPTTEDIARRAAMMSSHSPVHLWQLAERPALPAAQEPDDAEWEEEDERPF